jgi:uroporphyrinogen decarboxylase
MKPKDRVLAALNHEEGDRIPTGENQICGKLAEEVLGRPTYYNSGWRELEAVWDGHRDEVVADYCTAHVELPQKLEWDYVRVPIVPEKKEYRRPQMTGKFSWINDEGVEVHMNPAAGNYIVARNFSKMSIDELPDPDEPFSVDPTSLEAVRHVVKEIGDTHFIVVRSPIDGTYPWEFTTGMENFLLSMLTEPEFIEKAVDVYVNRSIAYFKAIIDAGADAVMTTDDYCDNKGPIMGPKLFKKYIVPGIEKQCRAIHEMGGYFIKHTDGNLWPVMDELVDTGIDGWHGIQVNIGMDMAKLKKRYNQRVCLFGGVNCDTLIDGTPEDARTEVISAIKGAGAGGGLVIANSNVVPPGAKMENYKAMRQAIHDFGHYGDK